MYKKKPCNADGCDAPVPNMNAKSTGIWRYGKCYECQNKHKATAQALYDSSASRKKARRIKAGREVDDTAATAAATAATAAAAAATAATAAAAAAILPDRCSSSCKEPSSLLSSEFNLSTNFNGASLRFSHF